VNIAIRWPIACCTVALAVFVATCSLASESAVATATPQGGYAEALHACAPAAPGHASCFALVRKRVASKPPATAGAAEPFVVAGGAATAGPAGGLTPEDLASAYAYSPSAGGSGQTVAIVDAYRDPGIASDLGEFDAHYGLPACTSANGCLTEVGQASGTTAPPDTTGWSVETTLDVETVHGACPGCKILLVEADSSTIEDLAIATNRAAALGATVISNSYGAPESAYGAFERAAYDHPGIPVVASTGDYGYYNWRLLENPSYEMPNMPASSPSVVSVGGTTLELNPNGTRADETVWGGSGGGCSKRFEAHLWQLDVAGSAASGCGAGRLSADVSAVADPNTGLDIYDTYDCGAECKKYDKGWETIGGTSLSAPLISALYALAGGGQGVPDPSVTLYGLHADATSRFDVTAGGNGVCEGRPVSTCGHPNTELGWGRVDCEGTSECDAVAGFDGPSGVGTPVGLGLFERESPVGAIASPASLAAGSPASFGVRGFSDPYPGGSLAGASWSWGDGSSSSGITATHVYAAPGAYVVTLSATDAYGVQSTPVTGSVEVGAGTGASGTPGGGAAAGGSGAGGATTTSSTTADAQQGVAGFSVSRPSGDPSAHLASNSLKASGGKVKLTIVCGRAGARCSGTITLSAPAQAQGSGAKQKTWALASASFVVAAGKAQLVTLRLSSKAGALLARTHSLHATASVALRAGDGAARIASRIAVVILAAARRAH
jgi:PKD domain